MSTNGEDEAAARRARSRARQLVGAAGLTLLVLVSSAGPAAAHAELIDASPRPGTGLAQAPAEVVIRFSERINLELSGIEVHDDDGTDQGIGATLGVEGDRTAMRRQVGLLSPGRYTVRWRSASPYDGHALSGSFAFGVGTAVHGAEQVDNGPLASEGWLGLVGRLGVLAGLAIWAGAVAGTTSARRAGVAAVRVARLRAVAVLAAAVGSVATGVSSVLNGGGDPSDLGAAFLTSQSGRFRLAVAVLAGVALLLRGRRPRIDAVLVAGAVIAEAASGHAASAPVPLLATLVFAVHLAAVGVWLYAGAVSVLAAGRIRDALRVFARPAVGAAVIVAMTGTASAAIELTRPGDLVSTSYGRVILAKSALFAVMALLGLTHRRARSRAVPALGRVRRPVLSELAAGGAAIALATLLVSVPNPPREAEAAEQVADADTALLSVRDAPAVSVASADGPFVVGVAISPPSPGRVTLRLFVTGVEPGDGLRDALIVATTAAGDRREAPLTSCGAGCFEGSTSLDRAATWQVSTSLQSNRGAIATEVEIPLPAADGSELLSRTLDAMERLSSARLVETLRSVVGGEPTVVRYQFAAPGSMQFTVDDASSTVVLGRDRYSRDGRDGPWEDGAWPEPGFSWPSDYFREFWAEPAAVRLLGQDSLGGQRHHVLAFVRPDLAAWFRLWIGVDDGLVRRLEMRTEGHLMDQQLSGFDEPTLIEAPPS